MESEVAVRAAKRLFELRRDSFQGSEFVGNGLDRSGTDAATAISNKIRIEYNIQQFESLQASPFPTTSFRDYISSQNSKLSTLHSQQKTSPAPKGTGDVEFLIINPVIPLSTLNDDLV